MKKLITLSIITLILIFSLVSCFEQEQGNTTASTTTPEPSFHEHTIVTDEAIEPTCTSTGLTEGKHCLECGEVILAQTSINFAPHNHEIIPNVESTCTTKGLTEGMRCSECGVILLEQTEAPLKAHTYDNDEDAICNVCNYERYCLHHNTKILSAIDATCTSTGLTEGKVCVDCNEILEEQQATSIIPHTESCWIVDKEATVDSEGQKHIECVVCHLLIKSEIIDKLTPPSSIGLEFELNGDESSYSVTGLGTCTDANIIIPSTYNDLPVTSIGSKAFYNCKSLKGIEIPDSVISIGDNAFGSCTLLTNIVIPDSVVTIGSNAFYSCTALVSVYIGNSVESIGYEAFRTCVSLRNVTLGNSVTTIGHSAFYNCSSLTSITIPNPVKGIEHSAFANCVNLNTVILGNSLEYIADGVFQYCAKLKNIVLTNSLTKIGQYAFRGCSSLEKIVIPASVTNIGYYAFEYCDSLRIYCEVSSKPSTWDYSWNGTNLPVVWNYTE